MVQSEKNLTKVGPGDKMVRIVGDGRLVVLDGFIEAPQVKKQIAFV